MKLALQDVTSGYDSPTRLNANNTAIEQAIENTLSRDGTAPNQMEFELDMNSHRVINLGAPAQLDDAVRLRDLSEVLPAGTVVLGQAIGEIGLEFVEGVSAVVARADSLPPLSQAIEPVWEANHQWIDGVGPVFGDEGSVRTYMDGTDFHIDAETGVSIVISFNDVPLYTATSAGLTLPRIITGAGAAATPSVRIGDEGDGFYREGADALGMAVGTAQVGAVRTSANGAVHTSDVAGALFPVGYKYIPQNSQSGNYGLIWADESKHIYHPAGAGAGDTYTIPANTAVPYPVGTTLTFANGDSNPVTIAITDDTLTLAGAGTTGSVVLSATGVCTALKVTPTGWLVSGAGVTAA